MNGQLMYEMWTAGLTRRWHTHERMNHTVDPTSAHAGRVCLLALTLNPKLSREAIIYSICHDLGEKRSGDFPYPFKKSNPEMAAKIGNYEEQTQADLGFPKPVLYPSEETLIHLCDWLDSYLFARLHQPEIIKRSDWVAQLEKNIRIASDLGVADQIIELLGAEV